MIPLEFELKAIPESPEWKQQMARLGAKMKENNVRHVFFSHGTYVGNDPLGINSLIEKLEEAAGIRIFQTDILRNFTKAAIDHLTKDLGNFTKDYLNSFSKAIQNSINADLFIWSGENQHMARVIGAVELIQTLAETISHHHYGKNDRLLLIGHSHAGQVFALLTTLLEKGDKAGELLRVIERGTDFAGHHVEGKLAVVKNVGLDFVTVGTPVRYRWGKYPNFRLISIVNDRNNNVEIDGILTTRDGDYVQQWGTEGTDALSPRNAEWNKQLDNILDNKGQISSNEFIKRLSDKKRKYPLYDDGTRVTDPFLVDYHDQDDRSPIERFWEFDGIPHCVKTVFGHGIYSRKKTMLFNTDHIVKNLYVP